MKKVLLVFALGLSAAALCEMDKKELKARYEKKYVVVLREGLAFGVCSEQPTEVIVQMKIVDENATSQPRNNDFCNAVQGEPIQTGEVLRVAPGFTSVISDFEHSLFNSA
jgi:hypothetical protein